ncbi:MAG: tetratricopeptide repeat protein [Myxococcales bacterium]|nr:tetratricopeptide repeat protein [Myxococcales bacterium]
MRAIASAVLAALLLLSAGDARADLGSARDRLTGGDYKGAITELSKLSGKDKAAGRLLLVEAQVQTGDYAGAEATAAAAAKDKDAAIAAAGKVALSGVHRMVGKLDEARKDVEALVAAQPDDLAARHALALVYQDTGEGQKAKALWQAFMADFDAQKIDIENPDQLYYLADAARYTSQFQFANDSYREAASLAPGDARVGIAWADLFLQKYSSDYAEQTLEEVFKVNPNHPEAHAAMAAVILEGRYDLAAVRHHLDKAFEVNPHQLRALKVRGSIEIDQNQWDAARKTLEDVLAIDPKDVEALAMLATVAWLRDDTKTYEARRDEAFAINKDYAALYRIVARSAVREHRYAEAIELEKAAVALKPDYYEAMTGVGEGYLRLGNEKEGLKWMEKSFDGDEYNVRTFNTLNLFDKTIPNEYSFHATKHFKIRYHNDEQKILSRYLEPVMERAFMDMVKRYGFTPKTPVTLELYADPTDYSVRTVGLPNLGALGVCFGQVITAMSPSSGDLNWGMVLWHELGHVFAIQLSNSRVPRWFTEGLSEYETLIARPEWRRENDADLYGAVAEGTLPSVAELNYEFMQPDANAVVVAYYLSSVTIEYIAQTYGFPKIVEALELFGKGKETPEVIETITGRKVAEFDADFRAYLDIRLAAYKGTFHLPSKGYDDTTALEIAADAAPKDAGRRAAVALGWYYAGDADQAGANAEQALQLDPHQVIARYVLAEVQLRMGDTAGARQRYLELVAEGVDSFDIRGRLAQLAQAAGDAAEVEKQLCAAKKLDPERSYPYEALATLYQSQGRKDDALRELEQYAFLEQMQFGPVKELVTAYADKGDWAKVRTFGELGVYINPFDAELLLDLGKAYLELGDGTQAVFTYDTALLVQPPLRRPALAHLGRARAYQLLGDKKKARAALADAMKTEPENAEALALKKLLK